MSPPILLKKVGFQSILEKQQLILLSHLRAALHVLTDGGSPSAVY
jgi:hypothetical protein